MADADSYVGQAILRREDEYLLRGQGRFIDDLPTPPDTLHLGFVLSPHAHARIAAIETGPALALDGVIAVLTGDDLAELVQPIVAEIEFPGYHLHGRDVIAREKVRFVGEAVAVVVTQSPYLAQDAMELVEVEYEALPAAAILESADQPGAPLVHEAIPNNTIFKGEFSTPDFEAAFDGAPHRLRERFRSGRPYASIGPPF